MKISIRNQAGSALIVSIVMLLLLTLLGVAGMGDTILQERMAGNQKERNTAFQNAELGLRLAESALLAASYNEIESCSDNQIITECSSFSLPEDDDRFTLTVAKLKHPGQVSSQDMVNHKFAGGGSLAAGEEMVLDFLILKIESEGKGQSDAVVRLSSTFFIEE